MDDILGCQEDPPHRERRHVRTKCFSFPIGSWSFSISNKMGIVSESDCCNHICSISRGSKVTKQ